MVKNAITIAILTHNRSEMVARAVRSALQQVTDDFNIQVVVVDDCSDDDTPSSLKKFGSKIDYIRNSKNVGVGSSSNIALKVATSEYFVRLDSDDYLSTFFSLIAINVLRANEQLSIFTCDYLQVDSDENHKKIISLQNTEIMRQFGAGMVFRTQRLKDIGGYAEGLRYGEDLDLHIRLGYETSDRFHFPSPLYRRNIHGSNLSNDSADQIVREEILRNVKKV